MDDKCRLHYLRRELGSGLLRLRSWNKSANGASDSASQTYDLVMSMVANTAELTNEARS